MRRWLRWNLRIAAALLSMLLVVGLSGYAWLRTSLPQIDGTLVVAGLAGPVEIRRDRDGVPTIVAGDALDAIRAQGFVHAQDRLFQMDFMRVLARGRLAEFVGRPGLPSDRLMRALDVGGSADRSIAALTPDTRSWLAAYAEGVNAFLAQRGGAWPPEFLLSGRRPEPWTPADSLLWGRLMAMQLAGNWREEILRARLMRDHPAERVALLWAEWPADAATTLALAGLDLDRLAAALPAPLGLATASNAWVLAGSRTASGKPILANDPHLGLGAPGVWYLVRIEAPGLTLAGASAPGVPGVVLGRNARVAWGMTTTGADTNDLFIERVAPDDFKRYVTPDGTAAFGERAIVIRVKDEPDDAFSVRTTRHGVVISDLVPGATLAVEDGHALALASTMLHEPDTTADALVGLNRARDVDAIVAALRSWRAPIQNVTFADVDGRIGLVTPGLIPLRKSGDGWLPQPGWTGEFDWTGFAPFDALPQRLDPPSGLLINANNRLVPDGFRPFIGRDWDAPYRADRIRDALAAPNAATPDATARLQTDIRSAFAQAILAARAAPDRRLAAWDGAAARDRAEALIFNAWMRRLQRELVVGLIGDSSALATLAWRDRPHLVLMAFADDPRLCGGFDCRAAIDRSLADATADLAKRFGADAARWRWGDAHRADFAHPLFGRMPVIGGLLAFDLPTDGDNFTVNRGTPGDRASATDFPHVHGPGLRAVYDFADLERSQFMIAPGQSGNPLSPHWGDLAQRWADGRYRSLGPAEPATTRLTLRPR